MREIGVKFMGFEEHGKGEGNCPKILEVFGFKRGKCKGKTLRFGLGPYFTILASIVCIIYLRYLL